MSELKLMVCTRCHLQATELPDVPDLRSDRMALATVHYDKRPPYGGDYTEATIYVTPHTPGCRVLLQARIGSYEAYGDNPAPISEWGACPGCTATPIQEDGKWSVLHHLGCEYIAWSNR